MPVNGKQEGHHGARLMPFFIIIVASCYVNASPSNEKPFRNSPAARRLPPGFCNCRQAQRAGAARDDDALGIGLQHLARLAVTVGRLRVPDLDRGRARLTMRAREGIERPHLARQVDGGQRPNPASLLPC
jgi:hypothetical protein